MDEFNELDNESFVCVECGGTFAHTEGTWPKMDFHGEWVITTDDETPWAGPNFHCYDCAP